MSLANDLTDFRNSVGQCDNLIANAHQVGANGRSILPKVDRHQITVAGFLNMFIAWETFLESSLIGLITGATTISGNVPRRYVVPPTTDAARKLIIGVNRYFDYGNHQNFIKIIKQYFANGYPYEPPKRHIF